MVAGQEGVLSELFNACPKLFLTIAVPRKMVAHFSNVLLNDGGDGRMVIGSRKIVQVIESGSEVGCLLMAHCLHRREVVLAGGC